MFKKAEEMIKKHFPRPMVGNVSLPSYHHHHFSYQYLVAKRVTFIFTRLFVTFVDVSESVVAQLVIPGLVSCKSCLCFLQKAIFMGLIKMKSKSHPVIDQVDFQHFMQEIVVFCQKICPLRLPFLCKVFSVH